MSAFAASAASAETADHQYKSKNMSINTRDLWVGPLLGARPKRKQAWY